MTTKKEKKNISEVKVEKTYKVDFKVSTVFGDSVYTGVTEVSKDVYNQISKLEYFISKGDIVLL